MNKPTLYTIFILKFLFSLSLIWWTITMTFKADVGQDDDNAFLTTYHDVDENFNNMIASNIKFNKKYNTTLYLNNTIIKSIDVKDAFLGQRNIQDRINKKGILKLGINKFSYTITSKNEIVKNVDMNILITKTTNHLADKKLKFKNSNIKTFNVSIKGYWNIIGTIKIGDDKGYFFIKTNAI